MRGARICSIILILFLALVLLPISTLAEELTSVTVQSKNFEVIKEIRNQNSLLEFRDHWNKKEKVADDTIHHPEYKIDIVPGDRWLYDPTGYTRVLSKAKVPIYKISKPEEFNRLLCIPGKKASDR